MSPAFRWLTAVCVSAGVMGGAAPARGMSGDEWRRLPPSSRGAYVQGIVDAWTGLAAVQESLGSRDVAITVFAALIACVRDRLMAPPQILALVERYAEDNPGLRGKEMADVVFAALSHDCPR